MKVQESLIPVTLRVILTDAPSQIHIADVHKHVFRTSSQFREDKSSQQIPLGMHVEKRRRNEHATHAPSAQYQKRVATRHMRHLHSIRNVLLRNTCAICTVSETCCYATHVPSAKDQKCVAMQPMCHLHSIRNMLLHDTCAICKGSETRCYATHAPSAQYQKHVAT